MFEIRIDLANAATLGTLASPVAGVAGALPGGFPGAPGGIYLIVNTTTNNRYAGISTNTTNRFNGRMNVVNELGLAPAAMAPLFVWWGGIRVRQFPTAANFPVALPGAIAGLPIAQQYAVPALAGPSIAPAPVPAALAVNPALTAQNAVVRPLELAAGAYHAFAATPAPRTAAAVTANWPAVLGPIPVGAAGMIAGAANAQAAAGLVAQAAGASPAAAVAVAAAINLRAGGGAPAPGQYDAAIAHFYPGGAVLPPPPGPTPFATINPVAGPPRATLSLALGGAVVDLERVFIRFTRQFLLAHVTTMTNLVGMGPMPWPAGLAEPICVTWHSSAGGPFPAYDRSVVWWPGQNF